MRKACALMVATVLGAACLTAGAAQPAGGYTLKVPAESDVLVAVPYNEVTDEGVLEVVSVTDAANSVITVAGTPFSVDQYNSLYFVRFEDGAGNGYYLTITDTDASTLTLSGNAVALGVAATDHFQIYKHNTLGSLFPAGDVDGGAILSSPASNEAELPGAFTASTSASVRTTEVFFTSTADGINKSPARTFYFRDVSNGPHWRETPGSPVAILDNTVVAPQSFIVVRNNNTHDLQLRFGGQIPTADMAMDVPVKAVDNDLLVSHGIGVPVTLGGLNLGGTASFKTSTAASPREDELFVYNQAATGVNKSPSRTFYFRDVSNGPHWRETPGSPVAIKDDVELTPFEAIVIRKVDGTPGSTRWLVPNPLN